MSSPSGLHFRKHPMARILELGKLALPSERKPVQRLLNGTTLGWGSSSGDEKRWVNRRDFCLLTPLGPVE